MSASERNRRIAELQETLRELEARFEREMRARGFDPSQAETVALPSALAAIHEELGEARAELDELNGGM
jgi:hypothetical protein